MSEARALFITLSNIGDLVLTTPALMALHDAYPEHVIDIVADARSSALLRHCPFLGTLHHRHKAEGAAGLWRLVRTLRTHSYAAIVDLRTDFLPWLLRGARRTAPWRRGAHGLHAAEQHFAVTARVLPAPGAIPAARVWCAPDDAARATDLLASLPAGRWLGLAPGANWPGKIWPVTYYATLLDQVTDLFSGVVLFGGAGDAAVTATLTAGCRLPCLNLAGQTSLTVAAALLDHLSIFVGNDSGLGHLAAARGTPSLTLFGPGRPARYRPWGPAAQVLEAPQRDLTRLTPATVAAAVRSIAPI